MQEHDIEVTRLPSPSSGFRHILKRALPAFTHKESLQFSGEVKIGTTEVKPGEIVMHKFWLESIGMHGIAAVHAGRNVPFNADALQIVESITPQNRQVVIAMGSGAKNVDADPRALVDIAVNTAAHATSMNIMDGGSPGNLQLSKKIKTDVLIKAGVTSRDRRAATLQVTSLLSKNPSYPDSAHTMQWGGGAVGYTAVYDLQKKSWFYAANLNFSGKQPIAESLTTNAAAINNMQLPLDKNSSNGAILIASRGTFQGGFVGIDHTVDPKAFVISQLTSRASDQDPMADRVGSLVLLYK